MDCLHYWVVEMHVDGFRFDLGSILGRDQSGHLMEDPPILERIAEDPLLRDTKIIAEAWDAAGAYQVGSFPGGRWAEWNDRYRNDVRRFWRGDKGTASALATRLTGSSDLYLRDGRKPFHSINFITAHDGFTLNDMMSYNEKHNEENGEENRDGSNNNLSYNYGYEGPGADPDIEFIRRRQIKNSLATLFLSLGTPMILGGDEIRRTQRGNNNAYCQNNEISWYDWTFREKHRDIFDFSKKIIAFRKRHPAFRRPEFFLGKDTDFNSIPDITWFNEQGKQPDWKKMNKTLAYCLDGSKTEISADKDDNDFYIIINSGVEDRIFLLPPAPHQRQWYLAMDTFLESPHDFPDRNQEPKLEEQGKYKVKSRSLVVLMSKST